MVCYASVYSMGMKLYSEDLEGLRDALQNLQSVSGLEVSEFVFEGHKVFVAKDTSGKYYIRGCSSLEEKGPVLRGAAPSGDTRRGRDDPPRNSWETAR